VVSDRVGFEHDAANCTAFAFGGTEFCGIVEDGLADHDRSFLMSNA
jgi:hypothetical protein